jgi:hypothetical protein
VKVQNLTSPFPNYFLIHRLFNNAGSIAQAIWCRMRWNNNAQVRIWMETVVTCLRACSWNFSEETEESCEKAYTVHPIVWWIFEWGTLKIEVQKFNGTLTCSVRSYERSRWSESCFCIFRSFGFRSWFYFHSGKTLLNTFANGQ